jgi:hypothetical protein
VKKKIVPLVNTEKSTFLSLKCFMPVNKNLHTPHARLYRNNFTIPSVLQELPYQNCLTISCLPSRGFVAYHGLVPQTIRNDLIQSLDLFLPCLLNLRYTQIFFSSFFFRIPSTCVLRLGRKSRFCLGTEGDVVVVSIAL